MAKRAHVPELRFSRVSKSGHSRCVIVPPGLLEGLGWRDGTMLELWIHGDSLVMMPAQSRRGQLERAGEVDAALSSRGPRKGE